MVQKIESYISALSQSKLYFLQYSVDLLNNTISSLYNAKIVDMKLFCTVISTPSKQKNLNKQLTRYYWKAFLLSLKPCSYKTRTRSL